LNGVSKNPSFHTDFVKRASNKKSFVQKPIFLGLMQIFNWKIVFWRKTFFCVCTFLKSVKKDGYFDSPAHSTYSKENSFHLKEDTMNLFRNLKGQKWKKLLNISKKGFFYKQRLDFHCPSKIL
jgi:hypothetical protein